MNTDTRSRRRPHTHTHTYKKKRKRKRREDPAMRARRPVFRRRRISRTRIRTATYLNIKMKSTKREKNTATLSMVRSITKSCLRRLGRNRTSFRILSRRKVRRTLRPELPPRSSRTAWHSSTTLETRCTGAQLVVFVREKALRESYNCP